MNEMSHRYAAILAADVAHYSRLMEGDGEGTVEALKDCREIFKRCVSSHHGREFGSVGDSLMAEFQSPIEALRAAKCIQRDLAESIPDSDDEDQLRIRIGLHAGDVISDGEDLFGDVVNTAARLQEIAQPGGIVLSALIFEQVKKEPGTEYRSLGLQHLKNIVEPLQAYEVELRHHVFNWRRLKLAVLPYRVVVAGIVGVLISGAIFVAVVGEGDKKGISSELYVSPGKSIAVLPFRTPGVGEDEEILAEGMHVDILTQLSKISALDKVIPRVSMEQYRDTTKSARAIAGELKVATILEGSVQRAGDQMRVRVELTDAATDSQLWAETYDRDLTSQNIFAIQTDIAQSVASALSIAISAEESERLSTIPTANLEAYDEIVRGELEMGRVTVNSMRKAIAHFERAINMDPNYASAYVSLAKALTIQRGYVFDPTAIDTRQRQREVVTRALELDPNSADAYSALAALQMHEGDRETAEQNFLKAIELNRNSADAHLWYSILLRKMGRVDEALPHSQKALELVPHPTPVLKMNIARQLFGVGEVEAARELLLEGVKADPEFVAYYFDMARLLFSTGQLGDGLRWANEGVRIDPTHRFVSSMKCLLLVNLGDGPAAEECVDAFEARYSRQLGSERVAALLLQGDIDRLIDRNERQDRRDDLSTPELYFVGVEWALLGKPERARPFWEMLGAEMFGDAVVTFTKDNAAIAMMVGCTLYDDGRIERANYLINGGMDVFRSRWEPNSFRTVFEIGMAICRGNKQEAISVLRAAVNNSWRQDWWQLRYPFFDNYMGADPEWNALILQLESDLAAERQWFEDHKDEPLFSN